MEGSTWSTASNWVAVLLGGDRECGGNVIDGQTIFPSSIPYWTQMCEFEFELIFYFFAPKSMILTKSKLAWKRIRQQKMNCKYLFKLNSWPFNDSSGYGLLILKLTY